MFYYFEQGGYIPTVSILFAGSHWVWYCIKLERIKGDCWALVEVCALLGAVLVYSNFSLINAFMLYSRVFQSQSGG